MAVTAKSPKADRVLTGSLSGLHFCFFYLPQRAVNFSGPIVRSDHYNQRVLNLTSGVAPLRTSFDFIVSDFAFRKKIYRHRNKIKRMFCRLKHARRITTEYDKLADSFLSQSG